MLVRAYLLAHSFDTDSRLHHADDLKPTNRLSEIKALVETLYGPRIIKWRDEATVYLDCVGEHLHTTPTGDRDYWLKIDGAPTFKCMHDSCRQLVEAEQFNVRSLIGKAFPNYAGIVAPIKRKPAAAMPRMSFDPIAPPPPVEDQSLRFIDMLFEAWDLVVIGEAVWQNLGKAGRYEPRVSSVWSMGDLFLQIRANCGTDFLNPAQKGLFLKINPMCGKGARDKDVKDFKHVLVDIDRDELGNPIPRDVQYGALIASGLPITTVVDTGNKGLHALVAVCAEDREEYDLRRDIVFRRMEQFVKVDRVVGNPSRFSRFPGAMRRLNPPSEKQPVFVRQELIARNLGASDWEEFLENTPSINQPTTNNNIPMNDTVIQLPSTAVNQCTSDPDIQSPREPKSPTWVLRFANTSGGQEHEFSLNEALPRNPDELKQLTEMAGGPLWRLVGALLALEVERDRAMEDHQVDELLNRYYDELRKYGTEVGVGVGE